MTICFRCLLLGALYGLIKGPSTCAPFVHHMRPSTSMCAPFVPSTSTCTLFVHILCPSISICSEFVPVPEIPRPFFRKNSLEHACRRRNSYQKSQAQLFLQKIRTLSTCVGNPGNCETGNLGIHWICFEIHPFCSRYGLMSRQNEAIWLRIVSKTL